MILPIFNMAYYKKTGMLSTSALVVYRSGANPIILPINYHDLSNDVTLGKTTYQKSMEGIDLTDHVLKNIREILIGSRHDDSILEKVRFLLKKNGFFSKRIKVEKYSSPYIG